MAQVDPDDDTRTRWVLHWYRYDPERRERRYTVVAAYTRQREFDRASDRLSSELEVLKAEGKAESVEHVSGVCLPAGYRAEMRRQRERRSGRL